MTTGLIKDAFKILSVSYTKIASLGLEVVDLTSDKSRKAQVKSDQLIDCTMLFRRIMDHVVLSDDGSAIVNIQFCDISTINDLMLQLKKRAEIYSFPAYPTPIAIYVIEAGEESLFDINDAEDGDMIVFYGNKWILIPKNGAPDGYSLVMSTPIPQWQSVVGNGIPSGGLTGQVLKKNSNTPFDVSWVNPDVNTAAIDPSSGIVINFNSSGHIIGVVSTPVSVPKNVTFSNPGLVFDLVFQVANLAAVLTWPESVIMSDERFDETSDQWTPVELGIYKAHGVLAGSTWIVEISKVPF